MRPPEELEKDLAVLTKALAGLMTEVEALKSVEESTFEWVKSCASGGPTPYIREDPKEAARILGRMVDSFCWWANTDEGDGYWEDVSDRLRRIAETGQ